MKERPILFSGEMVRAILSGRKTQTRRIVRDKLARELDFLVEGAKTLHGNELEPFVRRDINGDKGSSRGRAKGLCPYGVAGDRLWVRETWTTEQSSFCYRADGETAIVPFAPGSRYSIRMGLKWKPSIFMPRKASRILLKITDVRAERLQEITEEGAKNEGVPDEGEYPIDEIYCPQCRGQGEIGAYDRITLGYVPVDCPECNTSQKRFRNLWDAINGGKDGKTWKDNPWVWVITFKVVEI